METLKIEQADRDLLRRILMLDWDTDRQIGAGLAYTAEVAMITRHRIAERERNAKVIAAAKSAVGAMPNDKPLPATLVARMLELEIALRAQAIRAASDD